MHIKNVKSIKDITFSFPLEKGLYAITGENASGKSTLITSASTVFYTAKMIEYFGRPNEASIEFWLDDAKRSWICTEGRWSQSSSEKRMPINGFYEGSIIFGNRFKDTNLSALRILDQLKEEDLEAADDFVRENLGIILRDDPLFYKKLWVIKPHIAQAHGLQGNPYFYQITDTTFISQGRMSTGENLLISILHSLNIVCAKRGKNTAQRPCIVFLDEIELALHASALRRLVIFLNQISEKLDLAIFFSTHSLELIRDIKPQNIYYLERQIDNSIYVTNPCYPAFATRNLYSDDGYGNDVVIFVEDDLAKSIINRVLLEKDLINNIRIKILPTGGWTNTLTMAHDVISSRLLLKGTKVIVVLDRDIQSEVPSFMKKRPECKYISPDYLPISSLEKYLKSNLVDKVDVKLKQKLDNYIFRRKPLQAILQEYIKERNGANDKDGKSLYGKMIGELRAMKMERDDLVELILKYIMETEPENINTLAEYLQEKFLEC